MTPEPPTSSDTDRHWPFQAESDGSEDGADTGGAGGTAAATHPRRGRLSMLTVAGLVLLLAGLSLLGWVGYQYFGTNVVSQNEFNKQREQLRSEWSKPQPPGPQEKSQPKPIPGGAIGLMRIPKFGPGYEVPLVQGITDEALAKGIGVYDTSAAPGQIGNLAVAGHRVTHGEPFRRILELQPGDQVVIETREAVYTYVMDTSPADLTVDDSAGWVLGPVPGKPQEKPTKALLTITTCQDLFHSPDRSIGFGHLESVQKK